MAEPKDSRPPKRLRILALHSFRTSAAILEDQLRRAGLLTGGTGGGAGDGGGGGNDGGGGGDPEARESELCFAGLPASVDFLEAPNAASGPPPPDVVAGGWPPPYREWFAATRIDEEEEEGGDEERQREREGEEGGGCDAARRRRYRFAGLEQSERLIARALRTGGGYDGLVGFSQGAAMAAAMVAMQLAVRRSAGGGGAAGAGAGAAAAAAAAKNKSGSSSSSSSSRSGPDDDPWAHLRADLSTAPLPSFLVCIGAAMAPHPRHLAAFATAAAAAPPSWGAQRQPLLPLATCHLIGEADPVRPFSERLAAAFESPLVLRHPRGHVVPRLDEGAGRRLRALLGEAAAAGAAGGRGGSAGDAAEAAARSRL